MLLLVNKSQSNEVPKPETQFASESSGDPKIPSSLSLTQISAAPAQPFRGEGKVEEPPALAGAVVLAGSCCCVRPLEQPSRSSAGNVLAARVAACTRPQEPPCSLVRALRAPAGAATSLVCWRRALVRAAAYARRSRALAHQSRRGRGLFFCLRCWKRKVLGP